MPSRPTTGISIAPNSGEGDALQRFNVVRFQTTAFRGFEGRVRVGQRRSFLLSCFIFRFLKLPQRAQISESEWRPRWLDAHLTTSPLMGVNDLADSIERLELTEMTGENALIA